ncbi:hypothetical protein TNCV_96881 [Trichonephila clavipes]|nr:hypothetical protein TNCV_96881 [Trichonephila clavipes]
MDPIQLCPGKGLVLPNLNMDKIAANTRFLLVSLSNDEMSTKSPFAIHKALVEIGGEPHTKSVKRLQSGVEMCDLFTASSYQFKTMPEMEDRKTNPRIEN